MIRLSSATAVGFVLACAPSAQAGCRLNFPQALACFDPNSAAQAWRVNGRDPHALDSEVMRGVFTRARCVAFVNVAETGAPVQLGGSTEVATIEGRVRVLFLAVSSRTLGGSAVWIAADYITGACEPMPIVR